MKKKWETELKTSLQLYDTFVKNILLYNSGTWDLSKKRSKKAEQFPQDTTRKLIGIQWPQNITNKKLYEITKIVPLSITITERRWKLLGYILGLPTTMEHCFEKRSNKKFNGRKRTTIMTTLNVTFPCYTTHI